MMKQILQILVVILFASFCHAQNSALKQATKNFDKGAYIDAIAIYEEVIKEGYESVEIYRKLGDSYYFNAMLPEASGYYDKMFALSKTSPETNITPEYYFRYAQTLKAVKHYEKADEIMQMFNDKTQSDHRATKFSKDRDYLKTISKPNKIYTIRLLGENSEFSDFAPSYFEDGLVFSSSRDTGVVKRMRHVWNNKPFLNLYAAEIDANGELQNIEPFSKRVNTKYHESTSAFDKEFQTIYFTRNNFNKGRFGKDSTGVNRLKIYRSVRKGDKWSKPEELPFNSDEYSVAHPALSPDGKQLYFASDMPGSSGDSDLYVVDILSDGDFGEPRNLGSEINTEARETFPFISKDGTLFFASDGHVGLGGLDIFETKIRANGSIAEIKNVGTPVNSPQDDFTFILNSDNNTGYFASNRGNELGDDSIYGFNLKEQTPIKETPCQQTLDGLVRDLDNNALMAGVSIELRDSKNQLVENTVSNSKGEFKFDKAINCEETYFVRATKTEYLTAEQLLKTSAKPGDTQLELFLDRRMKEIKPGDDLSEILNISTVYFDLGKHHIRPDAEIELAKIVAVMKKFPKLNIEVRSHTDSRASDYYNLSLSERRNKATRNYIIRSGISAKRLSGKGYGESQLVNRCSNGVECTEAEHQQNRRSEFIITNPKGMTND